MERLSALHMKLDLALRVHKKVLNTKRDSLIDFSWERYCKAKKEFTIAYCTGVFW